MLLIRKKILLIEALSEAVKDLHYGKKEALAPLFDRMKILAEEMEPQVQKDIWDFIQQVTFQMDYDPHHWVTEEIKKAADQLISDLGFNKEERDESF